MITKIKRKRNPKEEIIFQILFSILTSILIGFLIFSNLKIGQKRAKLAKEIESLKKEIQILEEKKQKLEAGISESEKESYWEEKVREQGYVREGENPVVILPPKEEKIEKEGKEEKNFWNPQNWWASLLGWVPRIKSKLRH